MSEKYGYVFVHIPKTGGNSILSVLMEKRHAVKLWELKNIGEAVESENRLSGNIVETPMHARARDICSTLGADKYFGMTSFAVVRDPWDRMLSRYYYLRRKGEEDMPSHLKGSPSDFARWACAHKPSTLSERVCDRDGSIMVDHVLRFERLDEDFSNLSELLFGEILSLPRLNIAHRPPSSSPPFDSQAIEAIQATYAEDFRRFGYDTTPPSL